MEYKKVKNKKINTRIRNEKNKVLNRWFSITIYLSKMAKKMIKNDKNTSEMWIAICANYSGSALTN